MVHIITKVVIKKFKFKGTLLEKLELFDEAMKCYDKAIQLNPTKGDVYNNKGYKFYISL